MGLNIINDIVLYSWDQQGYCNTALSQNDLICVNLVKYHKCPVYLGGDEKAHLELSLVYQLEIVIYRCSQISPWISFGTGREWWLCPCKGRWNIHFAPFLGCDSFSCVRGWARRLLACLARQCQIGKAASINTRMEGLGMLGRLRQQPICEGVPSGIGRVREGKSASGVSWQDPPL